MGNSLVETYAKLVLSGKMTLEQVPEKYREAVKRYINNK